MTVVFEIDSNQTGLRYQEETSIGVANPANDWVPLEPNSYADFGGSIETVARNPINAGRQRKKGVTTDLDASGGFNMDLTQMNLEDLLQGFFFADLEEKSTNKPNNTVGFDVTNVDAVADTYDNTANDWELAPTFFRVGDLIFAENFTDSANNGLKEVTSVTTLLLGVAEALVNEAAPPAAASVTQVGFQFAAGDLDVDAAGTRPALTTTLKDFDDFGFIPGEWIFIGGDVSGGGGDQFLDANNNGWVRIRSIATNRLEFDKTQFTMVTEASTAETVRIFIGKRLRNRTGSDIKRRTYQLERTLGDLDDAQPTFDPQAEYLTGSVANEFTLNMPSADKLNVDLTFTSTGSEQIAGAVGSLKAGARPAIEEADAFNTSSDVRRIKLSQFTEGVENPTALFSFISELTLTITNNANPNKAVGTLGAFEVTVGNFEVGGSLTAYFNDVAAVQAVRNNVDITLDFQIAKANAGMSFDVPLLTLGDGRPNVEQTEPITLPLTNEAATGAKIATELDHTLMMVFYDFLPTAAEI